MNISTTPQIVRNDKSSEHEQGFKKAPRELPVEYDEPLE